MDFSTSSQTELCAQVLSYMSVSPNQAGDIYRNVHCYRLNNNGRDPPMVPVTVDWFLS